MEYDCQSCGACCARFRVSFYWSESALHPEGTVPHELVVAVSPHHVAMKGTTSAPVRCIALVGEVGHSVSCAIYDQRSSTCRGCEPGSENCIRAREAHDLPVHERTAVLIDDR